MTEDSNTPAHDGLEIHTRFPENGYVGLYEAWMLVPLGRGPTVVTQHGRRLRQALCEPLWRAMTQAGGCVHVDCAYETVNPYISSVEPAELEERYGLRPVDGSNIWRHEVHRLAFHLQDARAEELRHGEVGSRDV